MNKPTLTFLVALCFIYAGSGALHQAHAQGDASAISALSALPMASVVVGGSVVAGAAVALPIALSATGAVLVVKTVESTARGTVYVLERASDGARCSVEIVSSSVVTSAMVTGALVTVSVVGAGTILSVAGEAVGFVANRLGEALLYNERLAY